SQEMLSSAQRLGSTYHVDWDSYQILGDVSCCCVVKIFRYIKA
ncbi:MAG: hypothetical protein JWR16_1687, partial [Nevskia sp.]|nr:hypothetical protein [Nevskia sp.]